MLYVGDVGNVIELEFEDHQLEDGVDSVIGALDISTADEVIFRIKKPVSKTVVLKTKTAGGEIFFTTDGVNGKALYAIEAGLMDEEGWWEVQGYVELPTGKKHYTEKLRFPVAAILA